MRRPDWRDVLSRPARVERATERCDLSCAWCSQCSGRDYSEERLEALWSTVPRAGTVSIRIRGGDPFRYGDIERWVAWARQTPQAAVCIEGPAASLGGPDRDDVRGRLVRAAPDIVGIVLPTMDADRARRLTGAEWSPLAALDMLAILAAADIAAEVVIPVHPLTVDGLGDVIRGVAQAFPAPLQITLRRAIDEHGDEAEQWSELAALSSELAALPDDLPPNVGLQFDPAANYAPCLLTAAARRRSLFPPTRRRDPLPFPEHCRGCGWARHCGFVATSGRPADTAILPLTDAEAGNLLPPQSTAIGAQPRQFHTDRASVGLPNLLCFAPWTTLTMTDPRRNAVPCALSWVESDLTPEEISAEIGTSVDDERERELTARRERGEQDAQWYVVDNARLTLHDLWNSPLLRRMRREMKSGGKSSRCRSMCRVVMGVEERGIAYFQRSDSELTPALIANRNLLREEIHAGREVLTAKPIDLVFGVSAHCNISCGFCDGPLGKYGDLTDQRRDEIVAWLPTLLSFGVSGPGEPLMNKNFLYLLGHISDVGYPALSVSLTTNGTLMTPAFLERHRNVPWGSVRFSLNAGSAETYRRMTGKDFFPRILENLGALCVLRQRSPRRFPITVSLVLGSVQMGDLARFAKIVDDHGVGIVVEPMYDDLRGLSPWTRPERLRPLVDELESVAREYVERNPDIARAFRAVERFARRRLESGEFTLMPGH